MSQLYPFEWTFNAADTVSAVPRFLAIDLGNKRTGLALGDDATGIASPLPAVVAPPGPERWTRLARIVERETPDALVLGLPLHMDGSAGKAARRARAFAAEAAERFGVPVHLVDERRSSLEADEAMGRSGLTHKQKKTRRDGLAAVMLLQRYFATD
ncbi:Holliday junction resolvase RuvX [Phycisphaera mikurensis]|uniref:Putative pre-16S rRNA nuclease n=1 Tax=Phycisphaera mikurensis (strain NBRC 102666 / KCTC 22515 / FYK2301M01) TaxID=1142394 RepID=I0ICI9_PHYMF|nr:Holliday junction resolvase RuvX [Phycisphaera mikurensis]MBB6442146.1 putative Holliday junction resolvase [Phycisphaera mikurensis]BAM02977.1 putative Holliday junction resolvase [Phycisphaera mikurensis NBRC 102666]